MASSLLEVCNVQFVTAIDYQTGSGRVSRGHQAIGS